MLDIEKLKMLMAAKGIKSYMVLSEAVKIPYSTLNYMILGHDMYVSTLVELARFFQVPMDYLITKSFGVKVISEEKSRFFDTSSIIEATVFGMLPY